MRYIRYILLLAAVFFLAPLAVLPRRAAGADEPAAPTPAATAQPAAAVPYRAVWVSYLEWQQVDFSTQAAFAADVEAMLDDIAGLGATVVLAQVRPFGDALYPSAYFPFSHICTGTQGQDPGFDPLAVMIAAAHARGLQLEAWINPYRLQAGQVPALCAESPARLHPEWVRYTDSGGSLHITARRSGRMLVIDFADSAPGVSDEQLARLCERFYRAEGSRNRASDGSGLGLAICLNIVAAHGGTLRADHSPFGGVSIKVELPLEHDLPRDV